MKLNNLFESSEIMSFYDKKFKNDVFTRTLNDFKNLVDVDFLLIGGLAVGYYAKPRGTSDIDVIVLTEHSVLKVWQSVYSKFKPVQNHIFKHKETDIEIEVLSSTFLGIPQQLVEKCFQTSTIANGIRIPSKEGLIALKLQRAKYKDLGDIEEMIKSGKPDLKDWNLSDKQLEIYSSIN